MTEIFETQYRLGINFFKNKEYQIAIISFLKAKALKPDQCNVYYYLGESYTKLGDTRNALQKYTVGLLLCPNDIEIKNALSALDYYSSDKEEEKLRNNILLHPDDDGIFFELGQILAFKKDDSSLNESIEILETFVRKYPQNGNFYMFLGIALNNKGMTDQAIDIYEKAIRIDPYNLEMGNVMYSLEKIYDSKGNFLGMINKYQTLLRDEKNKNDISYRFALAEAYLNHGDLLSAKEEFSLCNDFFSWAQKCRFITEKIAEINEKIKKIKALEEKLDQFERQFRKFIETIFFKNNREISRSMEKSELIKKVEDRIRTEIKKKPYLKKEDLNPLDYFQIYDYVKLIELNWDIFNNFFVSLHKLSNNIEHINDFRSAVKHNRGIDEPSIDFCNGALSWFNIIFSKVK
jgi:tetratricopeptide (TPR) repeat protein